ncbi:tetratricopeptide repeat protein [Pedobacter nyackensis]|uniref:Tetratricopeptide repeat-containing protein n=1 Tax=Pedobacter nyackensis TaxID=475255 RepID=A0A1W2AKM6_9SPHI|nr:tetratricopeptide repeat protein [Pedobacter nyackensis]SMC61257.1 Tetratricopeptide repeat-containing protein [Pedobacter nyackensis]
MKKFSNELNHIIELYNTLDFSNEDDLLSAIENKNTCEKILTIVQTILSKEPHHFDALLWRIRIKNSPVFNDVLGIQDDCSLILNTSSDIAGRLQAYDWLIYVYLEKLSLNDLAIGALQDKLIDVAGIQNNRPLQDQAFGETYYRLAYLHQEKGEETKAIEYYLKSFNHAPKMMSRNYEGGMLLLELERFDEAEQLLSAHFELADPVECKDYAEKIEVLFNKGKLNKHWNLFNLFYPTAFDMPTEFGYKNRQEVVSKYLPIIISETEKNPKNAIAWRMLSNNYYFNDKNAKKGFDNLTKYYNIVEEIKDLAIERYYDTAEYLNVDLRSIDFPIYPDGAICYHILTSYLEKGNEAQGKNDHYSAQMYYETAKKYGLAGYHAFDTYFNSSKGLSINNEPHTFAMLCNNLGIVIKQVSWYQHKSYLNDECKFASDIHWQGYQVSPFWENLDNGMEISWRNESALNLEKFCLEVLSNFDDYKSILEAEKWYQVMFYLITAYRQLEKYEEAKQIYEQTIQKFEENGDEHKTIVSIVLDTAIVFFNFLMAKGMHNQSISYVSNLFSNPVYQKMQSEKAESFNNYFMAHAHMGLNDKNEAQRYFKLIAEKFANTQLDYIRDVVNDAKSNLNAINAGQNFDEIVVSLYKTQPKRLFDYPLKAKEENTKYLKQILNLVTSNKMPSSSAWVEKDLYIGFELRTKRTEIEEIYDSFFYIHLKSEDLGIRYELVEWKDVESGFLGLSKKIVERSAFYVCFYTAYNSNASDTRTEFEMSSEHLQQKAQYLWKEWINKLHYYEVNTK